MSGSSALPVIVPRTSPLETSIDVNECVSILSWNVLADCYFKQGKGDYSHVSTSSPELWNWPQRCELIVRELMSSDADIICLQEVKSLQ
jgi:mRNA deadenylase 3'-5' endonuclease subunit Ccr4